jgi:hypothetical protein
MISEMSITRAALAPWVPKALMAMARAMERLRITVPYQGNGVSPLEKNPEATVLTRENSLNR